MAEPTRPASFRGAPFNVLETDTDGQARRVQVHEYPGRELSYAEDLGLQAASFQLEAFVPWAGRAALLAACMAPGAGTLVHPHLGTLEVVCTSCRTRESNRSGGVTLFSLTFVLAGENRFPAIRPNAAQRTASAAENARRVLGSEFADQYQGGAAPAWVDAASAGWLAEVAEGLIAASSIVDGASGLAAFNVDALALGALGVSDGGSIGLRISSSLTKLARLASDPRSALRMLEGLGRFGLTGTIASAFAPGSPSRAVAERRRAALVRQVRSSAAVEAAAIAPTVPLESYDGAVVLRERVAALLEPQIEEAGDTEADASLGALEGLLAEVVRDLRDRGADLARLRTLVLPAPVPAVVLAYRLYGDADRAEEIVDRNRLRHPLFVPAARPLEVLSAAATG